MTKKATAGASKAAPVESTGADDAQAPDKQEMPVSAAPELIQVRFVNHSRFSIALPEVGQLVAAISIGAWVLIRMTDLPAVQQIREQAAARNFVRQDDLVLEVKKELK